MVIVSKKKKKKKNIDIFIASSLHSPLYCADTSMDVHSGQIMINQEVWLAQTCWVVLISWHWLEEARLLGFLTETVNDRSCALHIG